VGYPTDVKKTVMAEKAGERPEVVGIDVLGRRTYTVEFKRRLVELALEPGASVAGIALAHRINANQLFKWRQEYLRQPVAAATLDPTPQPVSKLEPEVTLLPVVIAPAGRTRVESVAADAPAERAPESLPAEPGQIEIALGRARVRVTGAVDPVLVETVLSHLQRR